MTYDELTIFQQSNTQCTTPASTNSQTFLFLGASVLSVSVNAQEKFNFLSASSVRTQAGGVWLMGPTVNGKEFRLQRGHRWS